MNKLTDHIEVHNIPIKEQPMARVVAESARVLYNKADERLRKAYVSHTSELADWCEADFLLSSIKNLSDMKLNILPEQEQDALCTFTIKNFIKVLGRKHGWVQGDAILLPFIRKGDKIPLVVGDWGFGGTKDLADITTFLPVLKQIRIYNNSINNIVLLESDGSTVYAPLLDYSIENADLHGLTKEASLLIRTLYAMNYTCHKPLDLDILFKTTHQDEPSAEIIHWHTTEAEAQYITELGHKCMRFYNRVIEALSKAYETTGRFQQEPQMRSVFKAMSEYEALPSTVSHMLVSFAYGEFNEIFKGHQRDGVFCEPRPWQEDKWVIPFQVHSHKKPKKWIALPHKLGETPPVTKLPVPDDTSNMRFTSAAIRPTKEATEYKITYKYRPLDPEKITVP